MLEKPNLSDESIIAALHEGFGTMAKSVEFLPIGNDPSAWAYRVQAEHGQSYFLKVKKGLVNLHGITIPHYLQHHGLDQVVGPFPSQAGELWHLTGEFTLILYPFIEGDNGMRTGLTDAQWIEYGTFLKALHTIILPPELQRHQPQETFIPKWATVVRQIQAILKLNHFTDPAEKALSAYWIKRADIIEQIVHRAEELGQTLQQYSMEFVLCHADIHTSNLLITPDQKMFVVDWDETILAPCERDLMFIVGIPPEQEALFFQGYGIVDINWTALAYYRYEWVVQEIGDYGARVFLMDSVGETTKRDAVNEFLSLFQPGDVVEAAYKWSCTKAV